MKNCLIPILCCSIHFTIFASHSSDDEDVQFGEVVYSIAPAKPIIKKQIPKTLQEKKLTASRNPILDALISCVRDEVGGKFAGEARNSVLVHKYSELIDCIYTRNSKENPTTDTESRRKALARWFTNFPRSREVRENINFTLTIDPLKIQLFNNRYNAISVQEEKKRSRDYAPVPLLDDEKQEEPSKKRQKTSDGKVK
jgi:hypothetical protein